MLEQGADVFAYDPVGVDNFRKLYPDGHNGRGSITYAFTPEEALDKANVCFIFTEWSEIKAVRPEDFKRLDADASRL